MRLIITLCLTLFASLQIVNAEPIIIGNNSSVNFSELDTSDSEVDFKIESKSIKDMISGDITYLITPLEWNDTEMAEYQQRYGVNPHQLVLAAFETMPEYIVDPYSNTCVRFDDASPQLQEEAEEQHEDKKDRTPNELAEIFSTRDGSQLLYLYVSEFESAKTSQSIASFLMEDRQEWFEDQGLIAIPQAVLNQNLVTIGLKDPLFEGGYR